jgi:hypothetical protein
MWEVVSVRSETVREHQVLEKLLLHADHHNTAIHQHSSLEKILEALEMTPYFDAFKAHHVNPSSLLLLTNEDLREV